MLLSCEHKFRAPPLFPTVCGMGYHNHENTFCVILSGIGRVSNIRIDLDHLRWNAPESDEDCIVDYIITVDDSQTINSGSNNTFIPLSRLIISLTQCQEVMFTVTPVVVGAGAIEGSSSSVNDTLAPQGDD